MSASLGTIKGTVTVGLGDNEPHEVGTFEAPLTATFQGNAEKPGVTIDVDLKHALADALREMADNIDPRPKLATSAVIEQHPDDEDHKRLLIDGHEFPWHIAVSGPTVEPGGTDSMTIVHVPIALPPGSVVEGIEKVPWASV